MIDETRLLYDIQRRAFAYFAHETNPANGLVIDTNAKGAPSSIAAVGLALTSYPAAVERGFISRELATTRTLATLQFFWRRKQGPDPAATGDRVFDLHFLGASPRARTGAAARTVADGPGAGGSAAAEEEAWRSRL